MSTLYTFIIALVLGAPLVLALNFFFRYMRQWEADKVADRIKRTTTYHYDFLGNPQFFMNPKTWAHFIPPPGNPAYPRQYLMNNGMPKELPGEPDRPLLMNLPNGTRLSDGTIIGYANPVIDTSELDEREEGEPLREISSEPELKQLPGARTFAENVQLARTYMQEGMGKEDAIRKATGLNSKGGKSFRRYAAELDK